jgi:hypothetical protein
MKIRSVKDRIKGKVENYISIMIKSIGVESERVCIIIKVVGI